MKKAFSTFFGIIAIIMAMPMSIFAQPPGDGWVSLGDYIKGIYNYDEKDYDYTLPIGKQDFLPIEKIAYKKINGKNQDKSYICIGGEPTFKNGNISEKFSNWVYVYSNFKIQEGRGGSAKVLKPKDLDTDNEGWIIYSLIPIQPAFITNINDVKKGPESNIWDNIYVLPGKLNYFAYEEQALKEKKEREKIEGKWISLTKLLTDIEIDPVGKRSYERSNSKYDIKDLHYLSAIAYKPSSNKETVPKLGNYFSFIIEPVTFDGSMTVKLDNSSQKKKITGLSFLDGKKNDDGMIEINLDDTYAITKLNLPTYEKEYLDKVFVRLSQKHDPYKKREQALEKNIRNAKDEISQHIKDLVHTDSEIVEITDNLVRFDNGDFINYKVEIDETAPGGFKYVYGNMQITLSNGAVYKIIDSEKDEYELIGSNKSVYKGTVYDHYIGSKFPATFQSFLLNESNNSSHTNLYYNGEFTSANGKIYRYIKGESPDWEITVSPENQALFDKYGEQNVLNAQFGVIRVGMPYELIRKFWNPIFDSESAGYTWYKLRLGNNRWYFRVDKKTGKVDSVTKGRL